MVYAIVTPKDVLLFAVYAVNNYQTALIFLKPG